jgi:hypothetical protein
MWWYHVVLDVPGRRFFARHGWLIAIAAAYLWLFPYFPRIHSANELPRVYLTQALVEDHAFHIDRGVAAWGGTADVSPSGGHLYSNKAPGSSMLAAPVYAAVRLVAGQPSLPLALWICRVVAGIVPTLLFLGLLWGFLERFAPDPAVRRLVLVGYAFGSMAMTYSLLFYSHQLGAVCVGSAWILATDVAEKRRGLGAMAAAGALAGSALLVDYQAVFAAVPVAVYVIVRMWSWPRRELVRSVVVAVACAAVPIALLLAYHKVSFGGAFITGYEKSTTFAHFHQKGFLGMTELRWEAFVGSIVRPDNGLITLAPWLLLAIPGAAVLARSNHRGTVAVAAAVVVIYVLFVSSINFWRGGWGVGPRYITAMLPFVLPLVAAQLQAWKDRPVVFGAAAATIVVGVVIYALSSATFPYWPDTLKNPLFDVTFRMLGDNLVAPSVGSELGIGGIAGILPFLAIVFGLLGLTIWRAAGPRALAIAAVLGLAVIAAYRLFPRNDAEADRAYTTVRAAVEHT